MACWYPFSKTQSLSWMGNPGSISRWMVQTDGFNVIDHSSIWPVNNDVMWGNPWVICTTCMISSICCNCKTEWTNSFITVMTITQCSLVISIHCVIHVNVGCCQNTERAEFHFYWSYSGAFRKGLLQISQQLQSGATYMPAIELGKPQCSVLRF